MFPRLLICEGPKDELFFQRLIEARGLPRFHIQASNGNTRFAAAINRFRLEETDAYAGIRDILIAADNDEDPEGQFKNACAEIETVFGAGSAPSDPLRPSARRPRCTVLMVPWTDQNGNLESLCVEAARDANRRHGGHVDTFLDLMNADRWASASRRGKAWLRANLAVRCEADPFIPLGKVFSERRHHRLVPVEHASFNQIADVLAGLGVP